MHLLLEFRTHQSGEEPKNNFIYSLIQCVSGTETSTSGTLCSAEQVDLHVKLWRSLLFIPADTPLLWAIYPFFRRILKDALRSPSQASHAASHGERSEGW